MSTTLTAEQARSVCGGGATAAGDGCHCNTVRFWAETVFRFAILRAAAMEPPTARPAVAIAIARTAQRRLHRTWTRLESRAKRRTRIAVAAARELVGFCC